MAYIQRNSYFRPLDAGETFQGQPTKIDDLELQTIRISIQTDVSGVLTIFQSIDGQTWLEFNDTFTITGNSHKQVDVKGLYFYVEYENGSSATGEFNLYTTLSKTLSSAIVGLQEVLVVNDSLAITGLNFDASGNLRVSGISGGGVSSDVNITNSLLSVKDASAIEQMTIETDRILYDTDIIANRLHDISGTVAIAGGIAISDLSVNVLNSSLDTHMYASSNGSSWHHLSSDSNGQLNIHSKTQDGAGNDITSTAVSGTETYTALDVKCRGTTTVSGGVNATLAASNGNLTSTLSGTGNSINSLDVAVKNVVAVSNTNATALITTTRDVSYAQVANNLPSVYGPTSFGSAQDTQGYTWIGAFFTFSSVLAGANIYIEFSPDGINWGRQYDSTYVSTGTNVSGLLRLSTPCAFRYVRLYADSEFQSTGVSAWFSMK